MPEAVIDVASDANPTRVCFRQTSAAAHALPAHHDVLPGGHRPGHDIDDVKRLSPVFVHIPLIMERKPELAIHPRQLGPDPDRSPVRHECELALPQRLPPKCASRTPARLRPSCPELLERVPAVHREKRYTPPPKDSADLLKPTILEILVEMTEDGNRVDEVKALVLERQRRAEAAHLPPKLGMMISRPADCRRAHVTAGACCGRHQRSHVWKHPPSAAAEIEHRIDPRQRMTRPRQHPRELVCRLEAALRELASSRDPSSRAKTARRHDPPLSNAPELQRIHKVPNAPRPPAGGKRHPKRAT